MSELYLCMYCGREVRPASDGTWREITGWVCQRSGGGAHGVHGQEATGRYACQSCMELVKRGISVDQGSML
jgi:DNA-directed RNA polymerase subunit RPC12/RpoP